MKSCFWILLFPLLVATNNKRHFGRTAALCDITSRSACDRAISSTYSTTYFVHPLLGNDANSGTTKEQAFKTLKPIEKLKLQPGDKIVLSSNQVYKGSLELQNQHGDNKSPIIVTSENWDGSSQNKPAVIDFKGKANGILIQDCSHLNVSDIGLRANGYDASNEAQDMRCGVLIKNQSDKKMTDIRLERLSINDVFYERPGFVREASEVTSANGTQHYGWGIRIVNEKEDHLLENILISNCQISNVSHTGIKLTGRKKNVRDIKILNNQVTYTGGPGIQMSEVQMVYVANNIVDHSGSKDDSRKWGRGSGLWTWGSSDILIEKNKFMYANGPGDSDGAHIDFNCKDVIIQYNFSYRNAGGFCEILGNNYNCAYRYNISVNDGYRIKGKDGAFQEGKTLWLSGYQGDHQKRKGPVNTYIYNNTVYADASLFPKVAFDNTSQGVMIANNIFYIMHPFQLVLGDQYKPDVQNNYVIKDMQLRNNLFLYADSWPGQMQMYNTKSFLGDPGFKHAGGSAIADYVPTNVAIVKSKGIKITNEWSGFPYQTELVKDILGNPVSDQPGIGAIEP